MYGIAVPTNTTSYKDFSKYLVHQKQKIDSNLMEECLKYMIEKFSTYPKFNMTPVSNAMNICANLKGAGFPMCQKYSNKKLALEKEYEYFHTLPEVIVSNPNYPDYVLVADKVEIRPIEKLEQNKVRTFCSKSLEHFLISTMVYEEMLNYFSTKHPSETGFMLGWSPFYGSWHDLITYLAKWPYGVNRDFEKFDGKVRSYFKQLFYLWTRSMLNPNDEKLHKLHKWTIDSGFSPFIIMPDGKMFQVYDFGNASGDKITFFFNCFCNYMIHLYCLRKQGLSFLQIEEKPLYVGGDDSHFRHRGDVDEQALTADMLELGFPSTYKLADDPIDIDFMGYKTVRYNERYVFTPNEDKLAYSFCVAKNSRTPLQQFDKLTTLYTFLVFNSSKVLPLRKLIDEYYLLYNKTDPLYHVYYSRVADINTIYKMYHAPIDHAALINQRIKIKDNILTNANKTWKFLWRELERREEPSFSSESRYQTG